MSQLEEAWQARSSLTLGEWAVGVSTAFYNSQIGIESAAKHLQVQLAEFESTLGLATMPDDDLELVSKVNPPVTTWLFLTEVPTEELPKALREISSGSASLSPGQRIQEFLHRLVGSSVTDRFSALDSKVFIHLARKAEDFGELRPKDWAALKSFGTQLKTGKTLSFKQVNYAHSLFNKLYENGVITKSSKDGDQEILDTALQAIGKG